MRLRAQAMLALLIAALPAVPAAGQDKPVPPKPEDAGPRTVITPAEGSKAGRYARQVKRYVKEQKLPDETKVELTFTKHFNMNTWKYEDFLKSMCAVDANEQRHGLCRYYDPQRGMVRTETWQHGKRHGPEKVISTQLGWGKGFVARVVPWKDGQVEGIVRTFYPDGKLQTETPHVDGNAHGLAKGYTPEGKVIQLIPYRHGKRHGMMIRRWADDPNIVKSRVEYVDGKVHGWAKQYYHTGQLKREVQAWGGDFHGIERVYHMDGELDRTYYWILDERVPKQEFDVKYRVPPVPKDKDGEKAQKGKKR